MQYLIFIIIGIAGGLFAGFFGVGGGVIIVPALVLAFGFSQHMAQGTMLATFLLPSFFFAVWTYYKAGNINVPGAFLLALGIMIGSFLGAKFAQTVSAPVLKKVFAVLVILIGLKLLLWK